MSRLDAATAQRLVRLILPSLHREYPTKIAHVLRSDADARSARQLTPMFFGSFDWHSSVHSHWSLLRLLRMYPDADWAAEVTAALDRSFTDIPGSDTMAVGEVPGIPHGDKGILQRVWEKRQVDQQCYQHDSGNTDRSRQRRADI